MKPIAAEALVSPMITEPALLEQAVRDALAHPDPASVDWNANGNVSPDEPPMPGKIAYARVREFTEALRRGQPHAAGIVKTVVEDTIDKLPS